LSADFEQSRHRDSGDHCQPLAGDDVKLKPTVAASLFAIGAVLSLNASAALDTPADAKVEKAAPQKHLRPDFWYEIKAAKAEKAAEARRERANAANDKTNDKTN
jgi:hypothetical protein